MALKQHFNIDQGTTFSKSFAAIDQQGNDVNLSNVVVTAHLKKWYGSNTYFSFDTSSSNSTVTISMSSNTTATIIPGKYQYDVLVASTNNTTRLVEGFVTVNPSITK